jgi:hypothetical protein
MLPVQLDRAGSIFRFAYEIHISLLFQYRREAGPNDRMIVG